MTTITFSAPLIPVKRRARSGAGGRHYTPQRTRAEEATVALYARGAMARAGQPQPLGGLWWVEIVIHRRRPGCSPGDYTAARGNEPDADNVAKAVLDACNGVVWTDDAQVASLRVSSVCAAEEGVSVEASHLGAEPAPAEIDAEAVRADFLSAVESILG